VFEAVITVVVTPRANRTEVSLQEGEVRVRVPSPPAEGAANRAVCQALAKALGIAPSNVEILRGEKSRRKTVRVRGLTESELLARLGAPRR
jgi:uncharacterized protein (TIGR00251 family)